MAWLNIASGLAVRFRASQQRAPWNWSLCRRPRVYGTAWFRDGPKFTSTAPKGNRWHSPPLGRRAYAEMFGPTVGDRVQLADTDLIIEVEQDLHPATPAKRSSSAAARPSRDGMGQSQVNGPRRGRWTPSSPTR